MRNRGLDQVAEMEAQNAKQQEERDEADLAAACLDGRAGGVHVSLTRWHPTCSHHGRRLTMRYRLAHPAPGGSRQ
jgi:hypothetical protein